MIILLVLFLLLYIAYFYFFNNKNVLSISLITAISFLVCALTIVLNWDFFGKEDISQKCFLVITLSFLFLGFGEMVISLSFREKKTNSSITKTFQKYPNNINIPNWFYWLIVVSALYITIARCIISYRLSVILGNNEGFFASFSYLRTYVNSGNIIDVGRLVTYPAVLVKASSLFFVYIFFFKKKNGKFNIKWLLPIVIYSVYTLTTTARTGIFELACFFVTIFYCYLIHTYKSMRKVNIKYIFIIGGIFVVLLIIFVITGNMRKYSWEESSGSQSVINYIGSPLLVFSRWLELPEYSQYFGQATMPDLINLFNKVGLTNTFVSYFETFSADVSLANSTSNLKTWLRAPIADFSILGMLLSRFLIGVLYSLATNRINEKSLISKRPVSLILTCLLFYPIFLSYSADRFREYIQLETIYIIFLLLVFSKFFIKKQYRTRLVRENINRKIYEH